MRSAEHNTIHARSAIILISNGKEWWRLTVALLREEKIGLGGGGEVGHAVACVKQSGPVGEGGVGLDLEGLVVTKVAGTR